LAFVFNWNSASRRHHSLGASAETKTIKSNRKSAEKIRFFPKKSSKRTSFSGEKEVLFEEKCGRIVYCIPDLNLPKGGFCSTGGRFNDFSKRARNQRMFKKAHK